MNSPEMQLSSESKNNSILGLVLLVIAVAGALFHLYTAGVGVFSAATQRTIHVLLILVIIFLNKKPFQSNKRYLSLDLGLCILATSITMIYLYMWSERVGPGKVFSTASTVDIIFGIIMILLILEAVRRTTGTTLVIVVVVFLLYALFGSSLPGFLGHKGYTLSRIISYIYLTMEGIYGIPVKISSTFIVLFVLFGSVLNATGGGKTFTDLGYGLAGGLRGGSGKTAVVASGLMGSISGSPIGNVVTTGTFTIPLMKKTGFPGHVAGAIEAVASTGGMIMPPVMGAASFVMAEYLGVPYRTILLAALIPALLYYISVYFMVDFAAIKYNVIGLPKSKLPNIKAVLKEGWHLLLPLLFLVVLISMRYSPTKAAFWAIVLLLIISQFKASSRISLMDFLVSLKEGMIGATPVAIACAAAGIVLGVIALTGLGVRFSSIMMHFSGNNLLIGLVITMFSSLILGMGLPAIAVYLITAVLNAPALIEMGADPLAAHMFVFYFGIISNITPPIALAAYAAAGIANSNINKTGFTAFYIGIVAYVVPYFFVYSPVLLFQGNIYFIIYSFIAAVIGVYFIAAGVQGVIAQNLNLFERLLFIGGGVLLVNTSMVMDLVGVVCILAGWLLYKGRTSVSGAATPGI